MTNYRKLWEAHYGPIPKDDKGRSYHIHHIDGDRLNNDITNLKCVSLEEHYLIHEQQSDWGACLRLAETLKYTGEELSALARRSNLKRITEGTHPFLDKDAQSTRAKERVKNGTHHFLDGEKQSARAMIRVKNETHHFLIGGPRPDLTGDNNPMRNPEIAKKVGDLTRGKSKKWTDKRTAADAARRGKKLNLSEKTIELRKEVGREVFAENNPGKIQVQCVHCSKIVNLPNHARWHGDKCRRKPNVC